MAAHNHVHVVIAEELLGGLESPEECCAAIAGRPVGNFGGWIRPHEIAESALVRDLLHSVDLLDLIERLTALCEADFAHVTYTEAIEILEKNNDKFDYKVSWGCDLQTEHERYLTEQVFKRPVFVTDYPKEIKAFYMKQNDDGKTVAAMDCLVPGIGEIIGGSQREDNLEKLSARMKELGLNEADYGFYLDLRKYGSARHSGFGLGFERCVMYLTGMSNIRDVIPFPRTVNNCDL